MNTAVMITAIICGTIVALALIGKDYPDDEDE